MAVSDEGTKRANGGGETLCSILLDFVASLVSLRPALLRRRRSSSAKAAPHLREDSRNPARYLLLWTRRRGPFPALFGISVGTITLLALAGLLISLFILVAATLNAIIVSFQVSIIAVGGFLSIFFASITAIFIGAILFAISVISTTTISAIIAVMLAAGSIGFFWIVIVAARKSMELTRRSVSISCSAISAYSSAWRMNLQNLKLQVLLVLPRFVPTEVELSIHSILFERRRNKVNGVEFIRVFVGTWNVGGISPTDDLSLEDWLDTDRSSCDIYVLGYLSDTSLSPRLPHAKDNVAGTGCRFQEIVPLSARNVLGPEKSKISTKWNSLIGTTLNKSLPDQKRSNKSEPAHHHQVYHVEEGGCRRVSNGRKFRCIMSKQMVGIFVSLWVRDDLSHYISYPSVSCIGCGIMGCLRNKGSVSLRFCLHETSFCFVCCHLASGGKKGDEVHRNADFMDILSRTCFCSDSSVDLPKKILDHDRVVLFGDLNYRISMTDGKTRSLVEQKEWSILLDGDQLRFELSEGRAFEGWNEGAITFSPTYKYLPNSDEYCWCDRILWVGEGLKQSRYERCESKLSDHRAVRAVFTAEADVLKLMNPMDGFFFVA
ncbi:hypothetical protein MUK42_10841 [Musa troglodytarum]|uniref:Inositol polyphosphate-related phosphatase domain-containing protein n=1 Tax=Musa troglodytarum TaxID=320322 RepID=A0A9E7KCP9_9LILI|nr:hypothetical protein MUK42_10841 [Musa troglodytarum]